MSGEPVVDNVTKMLEHALAKQLGQLGAIGDPRERIIDGRLTPAQALELGYLLLKLTQLAPALDSPSFNGLLWGLLDHLATLLPQAGLAAPIALTKALGEAVALADRAVPSPDQSDQ